MTITPEDQKTILDALATFADLQLKMIHWKSELAAQTVRLHCLEGEIDRAYRALAGVAKRAGVAGANPG
jgi:hypothetical protein